MVTIGDPDQEVVVTENAEDLPNVDPLQKKSKLEEKMEAKVNGKQSKKPSVN